MLRFLNNFCAFLFMQLAVAVAPPTEVLFLISSQNNPFHSQLSANLYNDILNQTHSQFTDYVVNVHILHKIFNHPGDWTLLTMLPHLFAQREGGKSRIVNDNTKWIILCEDSTHIALRPLLAILSQEDHTQLLFFGHALYDQEATIIHHFAFFENPSWFPYPMLRAGVVFTVKLLKRMAALQQQNSSNNGTTTTTTNVRRTEFAIDAAHELARYILDNLDERNDDGSQRLEEHTSRRVQGPKVVTDDDSERKPNKPKKLISQHLRESAKENKTKMYENVRKIMLSKASFICPAATAKSYVNGGNCAMYAKPMATTTCSPINRAQIYFAIRTCQKFHKERIPIMEATWAPYALHKRYFSDVADADIPTYSVGVPNVETGHCAKTLAILKLALKDIEQLQQRHHLQLETTATTIDSIHWIFLSDDDTLLSVAGVCRQLGCFNPHDEIYLGERYGYRLHAPDGFNYITGGGGIALSLPVVRLILKHCTCPTPTAPDDMILGSCLHSLQVAAIHSAAFHQARPNDYAHELLHLEPPVSFHKFWQLDPIAVYEKWFAAADRQLLPARQIKLQHKTNASQRPRPRVQRNNKLERALVQPTLYPTMLQHDKEKHTEL